MNQSSPNDKKENDYYGKRKILPDDENDGS